jgi:hypothetical protein
MMQPHRARAWALALGMASAAAHAAPTLTTDTWLGMAVTLASPAEKITQFTPFDVGLTIDSSTLPAGSDPRAFTTALTFSDTVDLSQARWRYEFVTDDASMGDFFGLAYSGSVMESFAPVDTGSGIRLDLVDPLWTQWSTSFTWLDGAYRDQVRWSVTNIIIDGDTTYGATLDDGGITGASRFAADVIVIDPPAAGGGTPVSEPPTALLSLAGIGAIGWWRRRGRRGVEAA